MVAIGVALGIFFGGLLLSAVVFYMKRFVLYFIIIAYINLSSVLRKMNKCIRNYIFAN